MQYFHDFFISLLYFCTLEILILIVFQVLFASNCNSKRITSVSVCGVCFSHVGIKQLVFGGKLLGDWDEDLTSDQADFKSYKI